MTFLLPRKLIFTTFLFLASAISFAAVPWLPTGPFGGDARSLAVAPGSGGHLYMGTTNSWVYESHDGGTSWQRLSRVSPEEGLVIDHILVDPAQPSTVFAAAWRLDQVGGGLWVSHDGAHTWTAVAAMRGQSIRSFAAAPSDPQQMYAGTLTGVFRSRDGGASWQRISPEGSEEIHEIESLAIDPRNPDVIYAGTWHLPWKTTDGGKSWHNIKQGVIDDSDVFSIIVDPADPRIVFVSACSGIYKSENEAALFHKIQGIPATARRTRVLKQDPAHRNVVYAGTTEGLYKSNDSGHSFRRMTGPEIIVNDILIDPRDSEHLLLATDRAGVLESHNGGARFVAANQGFSARKVEALLVEHNNPAHIWAGIVNDKSFGGVFASVDGGQSWEQRTAGLEDRDIFNLSESAEGDLVAGTNSGIFLWNAEKQLWEPRNLIANTSKKSAEQVIKGRKITVEKSVKEAERTLESRVRALDVSGSTWVAATGIGLLTSHDKGASWQGGPALGTVEYVSLAVEGKAIVAAKPDGVAYSTDGGASWWPLSIPQMLTRIYRVAFSADGTLWLGAREGVYFTRNFAAEHGREWMWIERMPFRDADALYYDAQMDRLLVGSHSTDMIFIVEPKNFKWTLRQAGFPVTVVRRAGARLLGASLEDGVLLEPIDVQAVAAGK